MRKVRKVCGGALAPTLGHPGTSRLFGPGPAGWAAWTVWWPELARQPFSPGRHAAAFKFDLEGINTPSAGLGSFDKKLFETATHEVTTVTLAARTQFLRTRRGYSVASCRKDGDQQAGQDGECWPPQTSHLYLEVDINRLTRGDIAGRLRTYTVHEGPPDPRCDHATSFPYVRCRR